MVGDQERVGAVDPGQNRRVADHRKHFAGHLDDDLVGVAVGHETGERAASRHPVAAGIVDDDKVDAAGLLTFGREPGSGATADDRLSAADHGAELLEYLVAGDAWHGVPSSLSFRAVARDRRRRWRRA